ncbi:uncharacterized protein LOC130810031 [Amaranthus tricolor]|uniref:uncharacterized protein LOC130810031 n=1 Tax=Amaranthus tricolor TaxID=29722 RepID=UPI0025853AF5|nr:uncharacterized protein LOC130810031 [Amaranthus tricolor]
MWGFGGRFYWGRREIGRRRRDGIVVLFAWMSSEERHLKHYIDLYASLGWNSLVCHAQFLNSFFPEKATLLALDILDELIKELKISPCPIVFASFSGGPKACMYKVLQIIEGKCETHKNLNYQVVRDCVAGHIYDSSPVDFTSDLGARFVLHPSVLKVSNPPRFVSWIANSIASGLDGLFLSRFESQRAEYWQTLYSSVTLGAPYLIMCSEDDDLAPCETICNFAHRLRKLGGDVRLVKWTSSPHVGHYRHYPLDYKSAVSELLRKASAIHQQNIQRLKVRRIGFECARDEISEPLGDLRKAADDPTDIFKRFSGELERHVSVAKSSVEYHEDRAVGSVQDEKPGLVRLPSPPRINANGVLGQMLFDVCVPKNIEEWDAGTLSSLRHSPFPSTRRHSMHFNPMKCIKRSRL